MSAAVRSLLKHFVVGRCGAGNVANSENGRA